MRKYRVEYLKRCYDGYTVRLEMVVEASNEAMAMRMVWDAKPGSFCLQAFHA